jgi:transposase
VDNELAVIPELRNRAGRSGVAELSIAIVERSFAWLGRNRRFSKDYEYRVQTSETMLDIAAMRLMLNRLVPA